MSHLDIAIIPPYRRRGAPPLASRRDSALNRYAAELAAALGERTNVQVIAPRSSREGRWRDGNIEIIEACTRGSWLASFEILLVWRKREGGAGAGGIVARGHVRGGGCSPFRIPCRLGRANA